MASNPPISPDSDEPPTEASSTVSRTIALVGRPNVGKSTLFNRLTGTRDALVADYAGLTRDRQYAAVRYAGERLTVIDTGGMGEEGGGVAEVMEVQARRAVDEADAVIVLLDARAGLTPGDQQIVDTLRRAQVPFVLAVNKADGLSPTEACAEFYGLGPEPIPISAQRGHGVDTLMQAVLSVAGPIRSAAAADADAEAPATEPTADAIRLAVIGRPNVGKSTLINRLLGDERVVVYDAPGTTRDRVTVPLSRNGRHYALIDTAGVRRRARVQEKVEKFSIVKSLEAIDEASVVALVVDAHEGVTEQDGHLAGEIVRRGRALVVVVNKWDGLDDNQKRAVRRHLDLRFPFLHFARYHYVSALHGSGVGHILNSVDRAHAAAHRSIPTSELNERLQQAVEAHQPPMPRGRRIKLRYAHQGGHNPPVIVIHGNQTGRIPAAYTRYLENFFRDAFDLRGTPVRIEYRTTENPFAGRTNPLSDRQKRQRERVIRHDRKRRQKNKRR